MADVAFGVVAAVARVGIPVDLAVLGDVVGRVIVLVEVLAVLLAGGLRRLRERRMSDPEAQRQEHERRDATALAGRATTKQRTTPRSWRQGRETGAAVERRMPARGAAPARVDRDGRSVRQREHRQLAAERRVVAQRRIAADRAETGARVGEAGREA